MFKSVANPKIHTAYRVLRDNKQTTKKCWACGDETTISHTSGTKRAWETT